MKNQIRLKSYGHLFLAAVSIAAFGAASGAGCSHSATEQPSDSQVVDRSNTDNVAQFNGMSADGVQEGRYDVQAKKEYSATKDGKTYYFSSASARDKFMKNFAANSRQANDMWLTRSQLETNNVAASSIH